MCQIILTVLSEDTKKKKKKSLFIVFDNQCEKNFPTRQFQAEDTTCGVGERSMIAHTDTIDVNDLKSIDNSKM